MEAVCSSETLMSTSPNGIRIQKANADNLLFGFPVQFNSSNELFFVSFSSWTLQILV
jgi:hypothetical protein